MAATAAKTKTESKEVYKLRSQNKFLFIATNYGGAQFIDGEFETESKDLYHELLRYNDVVAV